MTAQEVKRLKWRINQQNRRERLRAEREPRPLAQTPQAVYMRAYRRGIRRSNQRTTRIVPV